MRDIRNIAVIAHVDHGKTTLVDQIILQGSLFRKNQQVRDCFLDSNDLERERGITILSKNISVTYKNVKINVIDTPGHGDFGGQVERVLKLADGALLLVDAAEGPMPQTRFVLNKALGLKLKPVVVINKIDKPDSRPDIVHGKVFDLFVELGASDEQLEFPILYASGRDGWASRTPEIPAEPSILPLMDAILENVPAPPKLKGPVLAQIASLDYSEYLGRIGIGRVYRGDLRAGAPMVVVKRDGEIVSVDSRKIFTFEGLERSDAQVAHCGDIFAIAGVEDIFIGDTIADAEHPEAMAPIAIDEPTVSMTFCVNDSPLYGKEGKYVSSRHLRERLIRETRGDVALRVEDIDGNSFKVSGRGILHLSILIENMRREGYELAASRPQVILHREDGEVKEPIEILAVDVADEFAGKAIELISGRRGEMTSMEQRGARRMLEFTIPTRGMIGLKSKLLTATNGEADMTHRFDHYGKFRGEIPGRINGALVSMGGGKAIAYAIDALQQRGIFFVSPNDTTYEGMIVGENCKGDDLTVNLQKGKQLTNMRAAGSDRNLKIAPARKFSLEEALEYVADDELVEVTPMGVRLRKLHLTELDRKRKRR